MSERSKLSGPRFLSPSFGSRPGASWEAGGAQDPGDHGDPGDSGDPRTPQRGGKHKEKTPRQIGASLCLIVFCAFDPMLGFEKKKMIILIPRKPLQFQLIGLKIYPEGDFGMRNLNLRSQTSKSFTLNRQLKKATLRRLTLTTDQCVNIPFQQSPIQGVNRGQLLTRNPILRSQLSNSGAQGPNIRKTLFF